MRGSPVAVLPAAGRSRRMGKPKLLLPFGDTTVLGSLVVALRGGGVERIVLVVAPSEGGQEGAAAAAELRSFGRRNGLRVVENPDPSRGMLSSVQAGVAALEPVAGTLLVTPADLPALQAATVRRVVEVRELLRGPLAVPTVEGRRGHPLAIAPEVVPEIAGLDPSRGLHQLLGRHRVLEVPVEDAGSLRDVDTPEDLARVRALRGGERTPQ